MKRNGRGPMNEGPMTGRGMGPCRGTGADAEGWGLGGAGFRGGRRPGFGGGRGRGLGSRFGGGFAMGRSFAVGLESETAYDAGNGTGDDSTPAGRRMARRGPGFGRGMGRGMGRRGGRR